MVNDFIVHWEVFFLYNSSLTCSILVLSGVQERVMGGWDAPLNKYPWFAMLKTRYSWPTGCGGMLVAPQWVLTAAHCVVGAFVRGVEVGKFCRSDNNCNQAKENIGVDRVVTDPLYNNPVANIHDFALIKLESRSSILPVTMDSGYSPHFLDGRSNLMAIGFGRTEQNSHPDKLLEVEVKYVSNSKCIEKHGWIIRDAKLCAGENSEGACVGDSGGPLWDADKNIVVGVTSYSNTCDPRLHDYPGKQ